MRSVLLPSALWSSVTSSRGPRKTSQTPPPWRVSICFRATYLVLGLASDTVALKAVLVPQLLPAFLAGHEHVQVADGELRERRGEGSRGCCVLFLLQLLWLPILRVRHRQGAGGKGPLTGSSPRDCNVPSCLAQCKHTDITCLV